MGPTIDLMILPDPKVAIAFNSVVEVRHLGEFGSEGTGAVCQGMKTHVVNSTCNELGFILCKNSEKDLRGVTYVGKKDSKAKSKPVTILWDCSASEDSSREIHDRLDHTVVSLQDQSNADRTCDIFKEIVLSMLPL